MEYYLQRQMGVKKDLTEIAELRDRLAQSGLG